MSERLDELIERCAPDYRRFLELGEMRLFLELLPLLAEGRPVPIGRLAGAVDRPADGVAAAVRRLPNIEYDDEGAVVGAGLTLEPTRHRFRLDGRTLYTWCAWDALLYPPMLGRPAEVESTCPATGEPIRMTVAPDGVEDLEPAGAVLSFPEPDIEACRRDVRGAFCDRSEFFRSAAAARERFGTGGDVRVLTVEEGFELGRALRASAAAEDERTPSPIACRMPEGDRAEWTNEVVTRAIGDADEVRELDDGFELVFSAGDGWKEKLDAITHWVRGERDCCPFFRFEIVLEAEHGPTRLRLRGRPGVKEYIAGGLAMPGGFDLSGARRS